MVQIFIFGKYVSIVMEVRLLFPYRHSVDLPGNICLHAENRITLVRKTCGLTQTDKAMHLIPHVQLLFTYVFIQTPLITSSILFYSL